ncbi:MAG TPA: hypothetical protein PLV45_09250, partial [bacterium]|nr:hypothetical protein [bacterium]
MRFGSICVAFLCVIAIGVSAEEWRSETIDGSMKNGLYNAMTRDAQGFSHIVTYDSEEQTIEYLFENAAGWHVEVIEAVYVYGTFPSIALDAGGYPHVTYYDGDNDSIRYARKNQNGWVRQTVVAPVTVVDNTLIALNSSGTPYVFYDNGNADIIKCAFWNGAQWVIENVASGFGPRGRYARFSAVIDDTDTIHLSFVRYGATDLIYTYRDGSGWHEEVVDTNLIRG